MLLAHQELFLLYNIAKCRHRTHQLDVLQVRARQLQLKCGVGTIELHALVLVRGIVERAVLSRRATIVRVTLLVLTKTFSLRLQEIYAFISNGLLVTAVGGVVKQQRRRDLRNIHLLSWESNAERVCTDSHKVIRTERDGEGTNLVVDQHIGTLAHVAHFQLERVAASKHNGNRFV